MDALIKASANLIKRDRPAYDDLSTMFDTERLSPDDTPERIVSWLEAREARIVPLMIPIDEMHLTHDLNYYGHVAEGNHHLSNFVEQVNQRRP